MIPLIEFRSVSKYFRLKSGLFKEAHVRAVEDVSLDMYEGEVLGLVGESGCGKSTLGRLALAILKPTHGQVLYMGKGVWSMNKREFKEFRKNAQIIHQDPYTTLNPVKTIFDSLSPPLLHYKIARNRKEAWEKASDMVRMVGLEPPDDFLRRYPSRLSGGQMQRISIARAISINPRFIVVDEGVSMLDASLRIGVLDLLLDLKKKFSITYLFITHDFAVSRYFVREGRITVMYLGNIVEMGDVESVIRKPLHPYTQALIASVPVPDPKLAHSKGLPPLKSLEVPSPVNPPSGCKFHPRCIHAKDICAKEMPRLKLLENRLVACWLYS